MDVGELSNAAGSLESGTAVFGTGASARGHIIDKATHIIANNTLGNTQSGAVAAWWTSPSSQTIVGANTTGDVMNQLCRVCGEPAAGFHFGAFTCEGCKSFFGRIYNNAGALSECKNGGACVINRKNRTACKACRLRKCITVGMSKSGSRYGRRSNWFKIHCLLQEQTHQMHQAYLKDQSRSSFDKVMRSLDTDTNNTPSAPAVTGINSSPLHGRLLPEEPRDQCSKSSIHRPEVLPKLATPEAIKFPLWQTPRFYHPTLSNVLLGRSLFPFQPRLMPPDVNPVKPQMSVNIASSSSDSVSSTSPPRSPKEENMSDDASSRDKYTQLLKCFGPEQEVPMDLSKKSILVEPVKEKNSPESLDDPKKTGDLQSDNESVINETETGPPLDLSGKT